MNPHATLAIQALEHALGDDYSRASNAFDGYTPEEMNKEYGRSGRTCQQILDEYREHHERILSAIAWVERVGGPAIEKTTRRSGRMKQAIAGLVREEGAPPMTDDEVREYGASYCLTPNEIEQLVEIAQGPIGH